LLSAESICHAARRLLVLLPILVLFGGGLIAEDNSDRLVVRFTEPEGADVVIYKTSTEYVPSKAQVSGGCCGIGATPGPPGTWRVTNVGSDSGRISASSEPRFTLRFNTTYNTKIKLSTGREFYGHLKTFQDASGYYLYQDYVIRLIDKDAIARIISGEVMTFTLTSPPKGRQTVGDVVVELKLGTKRPW
jgi:hypothetical protein